MLIGWLGCGRMINMDKPVTIQLNQEEALVLFDFLSNFEASDKLKIRDKSEELVLFNVLALLEKNLVEPFKEDYLMLLKEAQNKVKGDN